MHLVKLAVADFGPGIPTVVRRVHPELSDPAAIKLAVQEGFTTKSVATNAGVGLDYLLKAVVLNNGGHVTIYSSGGIVSFLRSRSGTEILSRVLLQEGFCPGTTIAMISEQKQLKCFRMSRKS